MVDRVGRPRPDRLQRLRAGAHDRDRRAGADPVRGRADRRLRGDPTGAAARARPGDGGHLRSPPPSPGMAAVWLFDLDTLEGLLLGSIVASTDGAAIFALLRGSTLRRKLARTLEGEAGFNDPVAVLLVIGFIDWIQKPDYGAVDMAILFVLELGIGARGGRRGGRAGGPRAAASTARLHRAVPGRHARHRGGRLRRRRHAARVRASWPCTWPGSCSARRAYRPSARSPCSTRASAWVAQIAMFLALGLLVFPSQLGDVAIEGTALALVLVFVARPAGGLPQHRVRPLLDRPSGWCSAGPGCAARCRWCSRRSR